MRRLTAVATAGEAGQLFTVYAKNWNCEDCNLENYASRNRCARCRKQKSVETSNFVMDPALQALQEGKEILWQEVIDPSSNQMYYYNKSTGVTQWERPAEMGAAPLATGWFGRGQAGSTAAQRYSSQNTTYLSRPARKQKDFIDPKKYLTEGANEYNIWYGKFLGDRDEINKDPATDRCVLETDAGYTKADTNTMSKNKRFFCVHFAHGVCAKGEECLYYHRIPTPDDDARCDELFDCFGRQRHSKHRDDMNGTGSFMKPCRTLFVGNLQKSKYVNPECLEKAIWRHFEEWGELENCNVIHRLSIAFPRYRLRTNAEFAKEAMWNQALDGGEVLSIKWAHDDPNPVAQDSISRADKDALLAMMQSKGMPLTAAPYEYPSDYTLPAAKRIKGGDDETAYPNTDRQYSAQQQPVQVQQMMTPEQYQVYCEQYYASYYSQMVAAHAGVSVSSGAENATIDATTSNEHGSNGYVAPSSSEETTEKPAAESEPAAAVDSEESAGETWDRHQDPDTGAYFYYNAASGESVWGRDSLPASAVIRDHESEE